MSVNHHPPCVSFEVTRHMKPEMISNAMIDKAGERLCFFSVSDFENDLSAVMYASSIMTASRNAENE